LLAFILLKYFVCLLFLLFIFSFGKILKLDDRFNDDFEKQLGKNYSGTGGIWTIAT